MLVAVINTDGTIEGRDIVGDLASMQAIVGGLIQPLDLTEDSTIWVNEEGLLLDLPFNQLATDLLRQWYDGLSLVGTAFVTGGTDEDGNTLPIRQDYLDALVDLVA
jgi:hypothetical protein